MDGTWKATSARYEDCMMVLRVQFSAFGHGRRELVDICSCSSVVGRHASLHP
ncbi:conserved hypothetical protein [Ricinus communis]|uniref:Uncharacterized protein n=1 Tax=Ricinus communis TaxID=3988 RepID=B9S3G2_RICCO|nr:conserved hypothetical protein [Ricinus communis]